MHTLSHNQLTKLIRNIAKRGAILDNQIHVAAVNAAAHVKAYGDIGFCNSLYLAMPKGSRHVALTEWLLSFAGVRANERANKAAFPFVFDRTKQVDLETGTATPWFTLKPSKAPYEVVDVLAMAMWVLKKGAEPKKWQTVEHAALLTMLDAAVSEYSKSLKDAAE